MTDTATVQEIPQITANGSQSIQPFKGHRWTSETAKAARAAVGRNKPDSSELGPVDSFVQEQIADVRAEIRRVAGILRATTDPLEIDRLAKSLKNMREDERLLSNRPAPGAYRPKVSRRKGRDTGGM